MASSADYIEIFPEAEMLGDVIGPTHHYWRAKAANGEIVATGSEPFATRFDARRAAETTLPGVPVVELYPEEQK